MENKSIYCTLTDHELAAKADQWIDELIASGGKSWRMCVPARPNEDPDLIFAELNNRFKGLLKAHHLTPGAPTTTGTYFAVVRGINDDDEMVVLHYRADKGVYYAYGVMSRPVKAEEIIGHVAREGHGMGGIRWVKAVDRNAPVNTRLHLKVKGINHVGFWDAPANCYVTFLDNAYPITDVEWLDEQPAAGIKQINREWLCGILIDFTIAYVKSTNKDIANDAAEYIYDKLKDVGIEYVLSESEQPAAGREEELKAEIERRTKLLEDDLKRDCRLNMPSISEQEQEATWQAYKKRHNL